MLKSEIYIFYIKSKLGFYRVLYQDFRLEFFSMTAEQKFPVSYSPKSIST